MQKYEFFSKAKCFYHTIFLSKEKSLDLIKKFAKNSVLLNRKICS
ncbi:hypothetical protein Q787_01190 [Ornithobacterium rhinotracheale H06-030791]|nr:hypothetical protein Q785_01225 [Ornithobacterium rhinotracheale ORT-UMN 88]KGB67818.1 hypothetical protein Q787_01190 [Ornithobacterium rhinotracheale H06-030791]